VDTNTGIGNTDPYVPQIPFFPGVIQPYPKQPVGTPDFMLVSASESIRSSIDDLKAQEAEAKKQLDIAEKMYNLGLYAKQNFTEAELAQQKADYEAAQEALNQITAQISEKSALYYQVVRQEEFQSLNQNPEAFTTYQNTRQLETKLTEQGLDVSDQYHRTRSDQQALIDQTAEASCVC